MCRRWYRRGVREATTAKRNEQGVVVALLPARSGPPELVNSGTRTSSGAMLYGPNGGGGRFNHRAISSGKWAEVMRFGRPGHEGGVRESGYGFWFFAAKGSGIFLSVNRTWVLRDKDKDHSLEQEYSLRMARSSPAVRADQARDTLRGTYPSVAAGRLGDCSAGRRSRCRHRANPHLDGNKIQGARRCRSYGCAQRASRCVPTRCVARGLGCRARVRV